MQYLIIMDFVASGPLLPPQPFLGMLRLEEDSNVPAEISAAIKLRYANLYQANLQQRFSQLLNP